MVYLDTLFECSVTLTVKKKRKKKITQIPIKFPVFSFDPVSPCPVTHWTLKRIWLHSVCPSLRYLFTLIRFHLTFLFSFSG